jgi:hypothetical protein
MNVMNFRFFKKNRIPTPVADGSIQLPDNKIQVLEATTQIIDEPHQVCDDYQLIKRELNELFYLENNPDLVAAKVDPVTHYLHYGSNEGRKPCPDFDPRFYRQNYGDKIGTMEPFVHFITKGRDLGYRGTGIEYKHTATLIEPNGVVPSRRPLADNDFALSVPLPDQLHHISFERVAAIVHAFYPELIDDVFKLLDNCPCQIDIYISTDTEQKRNTIIEKGRNFNRGIVDVRIAPNRGRDVGPMLTIFGDVFAKYPAFLHLHTKKSPHGGDALSDWRNYLFTSLIGDARIIASNLTLLDQYNRGIVFPQHLFALRGSLNWGFNFENASRMLRQAGVRLDKDMVLEFPSGTMFWAKTAAFKNLLDLNLSIENFDPEAGQYDGTLAHAIERTLLYFCESAGFGWTKVLGEMIEYPKPRCVLSVKTEKELTTALAAIHIPLTAKPISGYLPLSRAIPEMREFLFAPSSNLRRRFILLVPSVNPRQTFGGIATAIKLFKDIIALSDETVDFAVVTTDAAVEPEGRAAFSEYETQKIGDAEADSRFVLIDASARDHGRLLVRRNDVVFATAWWTAVFARDAQNFCKGFFGFSNKFIYLIQDFEPQFYGWGTSYAMAESTYFESEDFVAIINSEELFKFFANSRYQFQHKICLPYKINTNIDKLLKPQRREKIIVFYGRPSVRRNAFEIICDALAQWQTRYPVEASTWRILSMGEDYPPDHAHPVQNMSVLGKVTIEQYAYWLNRASIGISLMLSPHPSYPPLEMAEAGLMVITNDYADRHMVDRYDLTSLPYLSPDILADAIENCVDRYISSDYSVHSPRGTMKPMEMESHHLYSVDKLFENLGIEKM